VDHGHSLKADLCALRRGQQGRNRRFGLREQEASGPNPDLLRVAALEAPYLPRDALNGLSPAVAGASLQTG
jgi:hypothetical protein